MVVEEGQVAHHEVPVVVPHVDAVERRVMPQGLDKGVVVLVAALPPLDGHGHVFVEPREPRRVQAVLLGGQVRAGRDVDEGDARQRAVPGAQAPPRESKKHKTATGWSRPWPWP